MLLLWTCPLRDPPLTFKPRIWMWTPGLGSDHQNFSDQNSNASEVPSKKASDGHKRHSHRKHDVGPRSALDQYSDESDQPHLPNPKNMLTRVDINLGPDIFHLPQRKIGPLWLNTGLLSPLGLTLIKTNLNLIQTTLIIGK